ncbi:MAG TPA: ABC transporter permease [Gemmatimonadales bacterium]|nr:ABC transporter permease [Gemmatimonadales bacterium]
MSRLLAGLGVLAGVVTLTFLLLHVAPGDPASQLAGPAATPEQIANLRTALGLDRPLLVQYATWLSAFIRGDWGSSIATGRPVSAMLGAAWPATALLVVLSLALSYLIGIAIGILQSRLRRSSDAAVSAVTISFYAMPGYWLGLMLVLLFTYRLGWLPAFGAAGVDADFLNPWGRFVDRLRHLALPLITLTLIGAGGIARYVREAMLDVRGLPFVTTARAKGVAESTVRFRHMFRNALIPVVTLLGLSLPALFSGAVFVEGIFAWPGVGRVLIEAVAARDYPVVMAATTVSAALVVLGNLLADQLVSWADPRVRHG